MALGDIESFIFGGGPGSGAPMSYAQLQARRKIAEALASRQRKFPTSLGEGLTYFGEKIAEGLDERRLAADDRLYQAEQARQREQFLNNGAAPAPAPAPAAANAVPPNPVNAAPGAVAPAAVVQPPVDATAPAAVAPQPTMRPTPQPPQHIQMAMKRALTERGVPEEEHPYYNTLAYNESRFNPNARSSTGAAGIFQFVPGTARQYGLTNPADPYSNTAAAVDLTNDNRRTLAARLGREPTHAELALAHNQGADTAANMLTGRANASPRNLAVNGVPAGLGPQQAAAFLQNKLGFGGDPRRAVAASMTAAPSLPPAAAVDADAGPAGSPQPRVQLASATPGGGVGGGGAPIQNAAAPGGVPVQAAPPLPTPNQQVAQAPAPGAQAAPPALRAAPEAPPPLQPTRREREAELLAAQSSDPNNAAFYKSIADQLKAQRMIEEQRQQKKWEFDYRNWEHERGQAETATKRTLEEEKLRQDVAAGRRPHTTTVDGRLIEFTPGGGYRDVTPTGGAAPNLTEVQSKDLLFYRRGQRSLDNIGDAKDVQNVWNWYVSGAPVVGNWLTTNKFQTQFQALREFASVVYRKESGANVTTSEMKDVIQRYFPQPGEGEDVTKQKEAGRREVINSIRAGLGKASPLADQFDKEYAKEKEDRQGVQKLIEHSHKNPVPVSSPEEAKALPKGVKFVTPDGRTGTR